MAEFNEIVTTAEKYKAAQKNLDSQIASMKSYLSSMGISVDSIKMSEIGRAHV